MKSVLAVADGGPALEPVISAAGYLADLCEGQLDVLHVRDGTALVGGSVLVAVPEGISPLTIDRLDASDLDRAATARETFERMSESLPSARFIDVEGSEVVTVVAKGRLSDVIVVGRPGADPAKPEPAYVGAAIFEAARPVVVVPPHWQQGAIDHAILAWNGSAQAARAIGLAIPLLQRVNSVTVLTVGRGGEPASAGGLQTYLERHGIDSTCDVFECESESGRARGRALIQHVESSEGDLLVMGAYGQTGMMRFLGLGSATGKVITGCRVPVLLAH